MHFDIISAIPKLLDSPFDHSILKRAIQNDLLSVQVHDLRQFGKGRHRQIDDYQYGGGAGMVLMAEPLDKCLSELKTRREYDHIIFLTPDGQKLDQQIVNRLSLSKNILLLCGHYKGIDERIRQKHITLEISIGDFVISGGELAAAVLVDAIGRLIPGVLNDEQSALTDSHQDKLLAPPVYTRPADYKGQKVPDVLISGHDRKIEEWRHEQALKRTAERRPDLLEE